MGTQKTKSILFFLTICIFLSGCSMYQRNEDVPALTSSDYLMEDFVFEERNISQERQFENSKKLIIEATVDTVPADALTNITLNVDNVALKALVDDLCFSLYPQLNESVIDGASNWSIVSDNETLVFSFSSYQEGPLAGVARYYDVTRDLNGQMLDGESTYIPHYMTSHIPNGVIFSAEEAGAKITDLLAQYSCFTFTPWSVTAGYDNQKQQGYYYAFMQQHYNGFPVYGDEISKVSAFISSDGVFSFGGTILLKEHEQAKLSSTMALDKAIEMFSNNFPVYAIGDSVLCNRITFGYIANIQDSEILLSPAWVFECTDTDSSTETTRYYNCACLMESREFWIESL